MLQPAGIRSSGSLVSSHLFHLHTNDHFKDLDNIGWVGRLEPGVQDDWLTSLEWIRAADRVIEATVDPDAEVRTKAVRTYRAFIAGWEAVRCGEEPPAGRFAGLFTRLAERWRRDGLGEPSLRRWDVYLEALWKYRSPTYATETEGAYRDQLCELGSLFHALPQQPPGLEGAVSALGMLDQFFNNLRDLREDAAFGMCRFPLDVLDRFGIRGAEFPQLIMAVDGRLVGMLEHLLATLVPELRVVADPLFRSPDLQPSWVEMIRQVLARHGRIEAVARMCGFDAASFEVAYWKLVGRDS